MSHGSDQSEDYWPGYVDALTSMVQVLAFVMMLLAVTVYVLSKSVSKGALEQVAKAAKVNAGPNTSVKDLTSKIVEQLQKAGEREAVSEKPPEKPSEPKPEQQAAAAPSPAAPTTAAGHEATRADKPAEPPPDAKRLRVAFAERTYRMDAAGAGQIAGFVEETGVAEGKGRLLIRAYASGASGAVTEARHLAYYRAMVARQALSARKVGAKSIDIRILDTPDKALGDAIEIFFLPEGAP